MSSSCRIHILPAEETDFPELAQVEQMAFDHDDKGNEESSVMHIMFGSFNAQSQASRCEELSHDTQTDPTLEIYKAVVCDGSSERGKVAGWAQWHYYLEPKQVDHWKNKDWSWTRNPDASNEFFGAIETARNIHMSGQRFALLAILVTLPEYQGQGIGSSLIEYGLREGSKRGLTQAWLEASRKGYSLYRKFGFEDVDTIQIDLIQYGGVGKSDFICMRKSCTDLVT
ncbi:hypothetical protein N7510_009973 [Penicillium lagena]|uniref:uncharacterized protein n=1 Tax=Penicillium lagena TaxID=94218 RepID=UPI00254072F1|nr:uncharacterized protein N7510_009973 [Penicillium lagena]KAJ5604819.1 hypothetical protein N7510_009973 [Penicillium lagena]